MSDAARLAAVNKRLTLNLLIQGVASHTFLTSHHLVRDRLVAIDPGLVDCYDQIGAGLFLNAWLGDINLVLGSPKKFWRRTGSAKHPFHNHPLLARHGQELAEAAKQHTLARAREKGVSTLPLRHYVQMLRMTMRVVKKERPHRAELAEVAKEAAAAIWGIDVERLHGEITLDMSGFVAPPSDKFVSKMIRMAVAGYSQVERVDGRMEVRASAMMWVLLSHELVKGVAELICLHGVAGLSDDLYQDAIAAADKLEEEPWLMQAGAELWRRFLAAAPDERPVAETLMLVARLTPERLESVMLAVARGEPIAKRLLAELG